MSAYIVSHEHIHSMIDFALRHDRQAARGAGDLNDFGRTLMEANIKSVCARYRQAPEAYAEEANYWFRFPKVELTAVAALKACQCFDYQACEASDYEQSRAAQLVDGIRCLAISKLDGYDAAPWGID